MDDSKPRWAIESEAALLSFSAQANGDCRRRTVKRKQFRRLQFFRGCGRWSFVSPRRRRKHREILQKTSEHCQQRRPTQHPGKNQRRNPVRKRKDFSAWKSFGQSCRRLSHRSCRGDRRKQRRPVQPRREISCRRKEEDGFVRRKAKITVWFGALFRTVGIDLV
ncbi:hypothetical protein U1Q18_026781 [Sarracenia purpurea var. burkii]